MQIKKQYWIAIAAGLGIAAFAIGIVTWQVRRPGGYARPSPGLVEATPLIPDTIVMQDIAFRPPVFKVVKGKKVTWKNLDNTAHTVTSEAMGGQHVVKPGSTYTFDTGGLFLTGEILYRCDFHPWMTATLAVVSETPVSAFANFYNSLSEKQRDCIEKSIPAARLFGLIEGYILTQTQDEQRAIDLCTR